jgi:hypothetical protein
MATVVNISGIIVIKIDRKGKVEDLIGAALGQNASSVSALSNITHDDAEMHGLGTTLLTVHTDYKKKPPTATKADVDTAVNNLVDAYDENAGEIQAIARKEAKTAGDVNVGINIVQMSGYILKNPKGAMENTFEVQNDGSGAVKIKTKAIAPRTIYIRQYGKASAKSVAPLTSNLGELLISPENDIRVENLDSGSWYAFREATVLPISRKVESGTSLTKVEMKATPTLAAKAHRRTFNAGEESNYDFGDWIWRMIL